VDRPLDEAVTRRVAAEGCPVCDGPLHRSDYDRKPRGATALLVQRSGGRDQVRLTDPTGTVIFEDVNGRTTTTTTTTRNGGGAVVRA